MPGIRAILWPIDAGLDKFKRQVGCNFGRSPPSTSTDLRACVAERNADTVAAMATAPNGDEIVDGNSSGGVGGRRNNSIYSKTRQVGCNFGRSPPSTSTDLWAGVVERNADTVAAMATAPNGDAIVDGNSSGGVGGRKNNSFYSKTRQVGCNFGRSPPSTSTDLWAGVVERNVDTVAAMAMALHGDAIVDGNSSGGVGGAEIIHFTA